MPKYIMTNDLKVMESTVFHGNEIRTKICKFLLAKFGCI